MSQQTIFNLNPNSQQQTKTPTQRKHVRYLINQGLGMSVDWDYFTAATGVKEAVIENISESGCLLRSSEAIENRRWIRFVVKDPGANVWFTAVGRIIRKEDKIEPWGQFKITLYRHGIEFIHPLNPWVIDRLRSENSTCANCGQIGAAIPDEAKAGKFHCLLCHLRQACHSLLDQEQDGPESA